MAYLGYATQTLLATFSGHMTGMIPADFLSLVEASIWFIPKAADADYDATIIVMAAAAGELYNAHDTTPGSAYQWTLVKDQIFRFNLTALVPAAVSANDVLGVELASGVGNEPVELVGLRLRYKIRFPEMSGLAVEREAFWTCEKSELPH